MRPNEAYGLSYLGLVLTRTFMVELAGDCGVCGRALAGFIPRLASPPGGRRTRSHARLRTSSRLGSGEGRVASAVVSPHVSVLFVCSFITYSLIFDSLRIMEFYTHF